VLGNDLYTSFIENSREEREGIIYPIENKILPQSGSLKLLLLV
jgi:hypothetical protein